MKIVLASGSPRRKEILNKFGYKFTVEKSGFTECGGESDPISVAIKNAKGKASDVFMRLKDKNESDFAVIGADTIVYLNGVILGKPKDRLDAVNTLKNLSGNEHKVITGFCVLGKNLCVVGVDESTVKFNDLSDDLINEYIDKCKPFDKAGSYGIQDGFPLTESVSGSVYNVIGLPIEKLKPILDLILL